MTHQRTTTLNPTPILRASLAAVLLIGAAIPHFAHANTDALIEGARQCTQYFPVEEKKNSIPTHLLAAIATTESGRYHKGLGMSVPWPWTINVEGKGYYFESKAEAISQVQNLIARGHNSIDVGCMQVNLKHHPKAFANLNQAFDPATNVAYAAKFLHDNYGTFGDWIKATAAYHSRTPVHGQRYLGEIERSWNRIVGKVAEARASKAAGGEQTTAALGAGSGEMPKVVDQKPRIVAMQKPMQPVRSARVIQVSDEATRRASEVMVVRKSAAPEQKPAEALAVAEATMTEPVQPVVASPAGNSIRRVTLDNTASQALPSGKTPDSKFVFAN